MKKLFLCIILTVCIAGGSLFAWDASYLMTYPSCTDEDDWIVNIGAGFAFPTHLGKNDYQWFPPVRVSLDKNVPLGEQSLPFFFGGIVTYTGEGWRNEWYTHKITTGARVGYHFNFDVENLDVYAVATGGWTFYSHTDRRAPDYDDFGWLYFGVNAGARYFISSNFGFWAEAGFNPFSWFDIGIALKF